MDTSKNWFFDDETKLLKDADNLSEQYSSAEPFPHIVLDHFFKDEILNKVLEEFPNKGAINWKKFKNENEIKLATQSNQQIEPFTRNFLNYLNSSVFIQFLEKTTGIPELIPDPHFVGGGLHQIMAGGKLGIHADFNMHNHLKLHRRINLLIYLNKDWKEEYGGHIELWDQEMKECKVKALPIFNRAVIFSTTSNSYHGHPHPLKCPEGMSRKSLALYYYSVSRPENEISKSHSTLFQGSQKENPNSKEKLKKVIKKITPPILIDLVKLLIRRKK